MNRRLKEPRINRIHLLNECRLKASVYSCAIDSFIEVCYAILYPIISHLESKSEFFERLCNSFDQYSELLISNPYNKEITSKQEQSLSNIRRPVWDYIVRKCPTFAGRNSDAEFSEIFLDSVFNLLLSAERELFGQGRNVCTIEIVGCF